MAVGSILAVLCRRGCRFVVVGSTARWLTGEDVHPNDLDVVVDTAPVLRPALVGALAELDAVIDRRSGRVPVSASIPLPWDWGWRAFTPYGSIDVVTRFVDDTTFTNHDQLATSVVIPGGHVVRCHPTTRSS